MRLRPPRDAADIYAFALLVATAAWTGGAQEETRLPLTEALLALSFALALYRLGLGRALELLRERAVPLAALMLGVSAAYAAFRGLRDVGLDAIAYDLNVFKLLAAAPLAILLADTPERRALLARILVFICAVAFCLYLLTDLVARISDTTPLLADQEGEIGPGGFYAAIVAVIALTWVGLAGSRPRALPLAISAAAMFLVIGADKRTGWVALVAALVLVLLLADRRRQLAVAMAVTMVMAIAGVALADRVDSVADTASPEQGVRGETEPTVGDARTLRLVEPTERAMEIFARSRPEGYTGVTLEDLAETDPQLAAASLTVGETSPYVYVLTLRSATGHSFSIVRDSDGVKGYRCIPKGFGRCLRSGSWRDPYFPPDFDPDKATAQDYPPNFDPDEATAQDYPSQPGPDAVTAEALPHAPENAEEPAGPPKAGEDRGEARAPGPAADGETISDLEREAGSFLGGDTESGGNVEWRVAFWKELIGRLGDEPRDFVLGTGFGPASFVWRGHSYDERIDGSRNPENVSGPHNIVVMLLYSTGLVGVLGLAIALATAGGRLRRALPGQGDKSLPPRALAACLVVAAPFLLLTESARLPDLALPIWAGLGLALATVETPGGRDRVAPRPRRRRLPKGWDSRLAPLAVIALVASLGALPYLKFASSQGALLAFKSAFDEDTYLLDAGWTPYRLLSDAVLGLIELITPGLAWLMLLADVLIPLAVVAAAWFLVSRLVESPAIRILGVLLLLFGQELFSLANTIVWPGGEIASIRDLSPPLTLELIPDATTSYFGLFRTPEPAVSWALLFGFLGLVSRPDPLVYFARNTTAVLVLFALLGFAYPFASIPILAITAVLLVWSWVRRRDVVPKVLTALAVAAGSYAIAFVVVAVADVATGGSFTFSSRLPVVTPGILAGLVVAAGLVITYGRGVLREPQAVVPLTSALLPFALCNQQLITGVMVSSRDWERYTTYPLVVFAALALGAAVWERHPLRNPQLRIVATATGWIAAAYLGLSLLGWQRDVYTAWKPANNEAQRTAALLASARDYGELPVVLENAGLTPLVRLVNDDSDRFVLDYTRLFTDPVPRFGEPAPDPSDLGAERGLFEHAFRLGWDAERLESVLRDELNGRTGGFYAHFLFSLADVWPPFSDNRDLETDEALARLPEIVSAYERYVDQALADPPAPALLVTDKPPVEVDGRRYELLGTAPGDSDSQPELRLYREEAR